MGLYIHWAESNQIDIKYAIILASLATRQSTFRAFDKNKLGFMSSQTFPKITEFANFLMSLKEKKNNKGFEFLN